jgi:hypothetical protein
MKLKATQGDEAGEDLLCVARAPEAAIRLGSAELTSSPPADRLRDNPTGVHMSHFNRDIKSASHLIHLIASTRQHHPNFVLFLGAGASVESGVKTAGKMVEEWRPQYCKIHGRTPQRELSKETDRRHRNGQSSGSVARPETSEGLCEKQQRNLKK